MRICCHSLPFSWTTQSHSFLQHLITQLNHRRFCFQLMDEPASAEIDVDLHAEGVTGWGQPLLDALARACGLPAVSEVWVRHPGGEIDGPLPGGRPDRSAWRIVSDPDVTVLVRGAGSNSAPVGRSALSTPLHPTASSHGESSLGFEFPTLSEGEQNWRRVQALFLDEPCIVPRVMQEVRSIIHCFISTSLAAWLTPRSCAS